LARLPALINAYAKLDGRDFVTIQHIARTIREDGFIPTTKRGSGASTMSEREVVNLILGANGAENAREAGDAIKRLRRLMNFGPIPQPDESKGLNHAEEYIRFGSPEERLAEVQRRWGHTVWRDLIPIKYFGDACEWLVRNAASIDAEMTEIRRAAILEDLTQRGDPSCTKIASGNDPEWEECVADWDRIITVKLTITHDEAFFECSAPGLMAASPSNLDGFPNIRLSYSSGRDDDGPLRHRRVSIAIDFHVIRELSLLVAPGASRRELLVEARARIASWSPASWALPLPEKRPWHSGRTVVIRRPSEPANSGEEE
jgi:hypothetical protein